MILTICERLSGTDNIKIKFDTLEEKLIFSVVDMRSLILECRVEYKYSNDGKKINVEYHGSIADHFDKDTIEEDGKKVPLTLDLYLKNFGEYQHFHKETLKALKTLNLSNYRDDK